MAIWPSQSLWLGKTKCLNVSSRVLFILSVCPSVWGWKAVDKRWLVPRISRRAVMKRPVKRGSLSLTIALGRPWCFMTWLTYRRAVSSPVTCTVVGMRCVILDNLSTTTKSAVCPLFVFGRCMIKSMVTTSHVCSGFGRGFSKPAGFCVELLLTWQEGQCFTYSVTSLRRSGHQKSF